jgi:RNA polymerase sigma-70 factor (ECF subfamily)
MAVIDGFSHKEIGEQLHISEGTSRWHLAEAKKKLRELLGTQLGEWPAERSDKAK